MMKNNAIGIVGTIESTPELIINASDWKYRVYETRLKRKRPSGTEDVFILQFDGRSLGEKGILDKIVDDIEVLIYGEVRTENIDNPPFGETRVKVFIYAEILLINNPPAEQQNEVLIRGNICCIPRARHIRRKNKEMVVTDIIVAAKNQMRTHYIPCICWGSEAELAKRLEPSTSVNITGRFQARQYRKNIKDNPIPYLMTAYEVSVTKINVNEQTGVKGNAGN